MSETKLQQLSSAGQSIWLDYIDRPLLETGKLKNMIGQGLRGMTSNPSIFNNAIGASNDYDEKIVELKAQGKDLFEIYDALTIRDIQDAADQFKSVYDETNGLDGYVSLEINPKLARNVNDSIDEGIRLYKAVDRANVMIKVPATHEGYQVVEALIANGINVNTTLIFSAKQYENTVKSYFKGLKRLHENDGDLSKVRSVASVFVSRIDSAIDTLINDKLNMNDSAECRSKLTSLLGKAAVANARIIYETFKEIHAGEEFQKLFDLNANEQRVLWASTGTKNPDYSDVKYVTELIAKPTVNTLPEKTLNAFLDHGEVAPALNNAVAQANEVKDGLFEFGIGIDQVCSQLLDAGIEAFETSFDELFASLEKKAAQLSVS